MIKMWQNLNPEDVIIGKNAIENLTEGMYKNPMELMRPKVRESTSQVRNQK